MKKCAYCQNEGPFTKEHILPSWLYKLTQSQDVQYLERTNSIVDSELTIKDVCKLCNEGKLSRIDSYGKQLYNKYFKHYLDKNETIQFNYDFNKLSRFLLKLFYNSARVHNSTDMYILEKFRHYILDGINIPNNISLLLLLISPYYDNNGPIYPDITRIINIKNDWYYKRFSLSRIAAIKSYYLFLFSPKNNDKEFPFAQSIEEIKNKYPKIVVLDSDGSASVSVSSLSVADITRGHLISKQNIYKKRLDNGK